MMIKKHKEGKYQQIKRGYGDYLYNQDRIRFESNYQEYCEKIGKKITKKEFIEYLNKTC